MDHEQIKEVVYNALRPCYRPVSQNGFWELVQDTFYDSEPIQGSNPPVMKKKLVQSRKFTKSTYKKALNDLVEDDMVYVFDDKETRIGRKLYYANVDYDELRGLVPSRLDKMLNVYQEKFDAILNNFGALDNNERAKLLWKLYLLLFTAENQVRLYFEIYSKTLNTKPLLSRIQNMRNMLDKRLHSIGLSNDKELIQVLLNEVIHTAITSYDSIDIKNDLKY